MHQTCPALTCDFSRSVVLFWEEGSTRTNFSEGLPENAGTVHICSIHLAQGLWVYLVARNKFLLKFLYILVKQGIVRVNPTQSQISDGDQKRRMPKKLPNWLKRFADNIEMEKKDTSQVLGNAQSLIVQILHTKVSKKIGRSFLFLIYLELFTLPWFSQVGWYLKTFHGSLHLRLTSVHVELEILRWSILRRGIQKSCLYIWNSFMFYLFQLNEWYPFLCLIGTITN